MKTLCWHKNILTTSSHRKTQKCNTDSDEEKSAIYIAGIVDMKMPFLSFRWPKLIKCERIRISEKSFKRLYVSSPVGLLSQVWYHWVGKSERLIERERERVGVAQKNGKWQSYCGFLAEFALAGSKMLKGNKWQKRRRGTSCQYERLQYITILHFD